MKKTMRCLGIIALTAVIARHGCRCFTAKAGALAGVFAKQKLLCILIAGTLLVCNGCHMDGMVDDGTTGGGGGVQTGGGTNPVAGDFNIIGLSNKSNVIKIPLLIL